MDHAHGRAHRPERAEHAAGNGLVQVGDEPADAADGVPRQRSRRSELRPLHHFTKVLHGGRTLASPPRLSARGGV